MCFCVLCAVSSIAAPCLAVDWPPTQLIGAWLVTSTSVDDDPDVTRGNLVFLFDKDRLILAESFRQNDSIPYADVFRISAAVLDEEEYTAVLHIPAVGPSCFSAGHKESETSVTLSIGHKDGVDHLKMKMEGLTLTATKIGHDAASKSIRSLLSDPDLDCTKDVRRVLSEYSAPITKSTTDEP